MIARLCVRYTLACLLLAVASSAAIADDMVIHWNRIHLDAIRADKTPPPMAARNLAIMHTAIYDAVNSFDQTHRPYLVWANAPNKSSVVAAAAGAAHTALVELYPARAAIFDAELDDSLTEIPRGPAKSGAQFGRAVARKILKARRNDGADRVVAYTPGTAPGEWRPTPPAFAPALLPQWPFVTPFAMFAGSQFRPAGPPAADSDAYTASFDEVAVMGSVNSPLRTAEQTEIALFWADGAGSETPPGHWNQIAQNVAIAEETSLAENARLFALLNIALADAGICSWDAKYFFEFWRPITGIRLADTDGNDDTTADSTWTPLLTTPPFPAYTSGHSTFSSAAAAVLAGFFGGDDVEFTTGCDALPGVTRTFQSFSAAAAEAGQSRIYGGIHWQFDNQDGLEAGAALGEYVFENFLLPRSGHRGR